MVESNSCENSESGQAMGRTAVGVIVAYAACVLIWGTTWNAVRLCVLPGGFHPYTAAAARFGFAAAFLVLIWLTGLSRARPNCKYAASWIAGAGVLGVVSLGLVYTAQKSVSGGLAAIVATTGPLVMALLATVLKIEKVSLNSLLGAVISLAGIAILFGDRLQVSSDQAFGIVLLLLSVVLNAFMGIILKKHAAGEHPFVSVALSVAISLPCFFALSLGCERTDFAALSMVSVLCAAYLGVMGSVVSFACYFYLLKRLKLMTISTMVFFPPIIALTVDCFIERHISLSALSYAGIGVTMVGVAIGLLLEPLQRRRARMVPARIELQDAEP